MIAYLGFLNALSERPEPMIRTTLAQHQAHVAGAPRPCGVFAFGYQWRDGNGSMMNLKSINVTATKRPARRLGLLTT